MKNEQLQEIKTLKDCLLKVGYASKKQYFIRVMPEFRDKIECYESLLMITEALNDGWEWDGKSSYYSVCYYCNNLETMCSSFYSSLIQPFKFKDKETAQKGLEIGKEEWKIFLGVKL